MEVTQPWISKSTNKQNAEKPYNVILFIKNRMEFLIYAIAHINPGVIKLSKNEPIIKKYGMILHAWVPESSKNHR